MYWVWHSSCTLQHLELVVRYFFMVLEIIHHNLITLATSVLKVLFEKSEDQGNF